MTRRLGDDLEDILRRSDAVATAYHCHHDCTDFEVDTMRRHLGEDLLSMATAAVGLSSYRTKQDLDRLIPALRYGLAGS